MTLYILLILLLTFIGSRFFFTETNSEYLSKENSNTWKGIFILFIFATHFTSYGGNFTGSADILFWRIYCFLGQSVVAFFLFSSGYGVMLSRQQKGPAYTATFLRRRILPTYLIYCLSQLLFWGLQLLLGTQYTLKDIVLAFTAIKSFGNDNWYIFTILVLYSISHISFKAFPCSCKSAAYAMTAGVLVYVSIMFAVIPERSYWYDTAFCYLFGAWYALYETPIQRKLTRTRCYWPALALTGLAFLIFHELPTAYTLLSVMIQNIRHIFFATAIILISMRFAIHSPVLEYCGRHLQGLFLLHRLPMILFNTGVFHVNENMYLHFGLSVAVTFVLEYFFQRMTSFITEKIS